jgi:hypothetical protein
MREVAVRWLVHHSQMRPDDLGIVYGASKLSQLEESLTDQLRTFFARFFFFWLPPFFFCGVQQSADIEIYFHCSVKGSLPEEVVAALDNAWLELKPYVPLYDME